MTFDGLFYQGDVWLDGGYLGDTEGYFLPHTFEVSDQLRDRAEHVVAVEVTCPPPGPAARRTITGAFHHGDHVDPAGNPGGIWRPVRLTETGPVRIATLRVVCSEASPERAVLTLRAVLDSDAPPPGAAAHRGGGRSTTRPTSPWPQAPTRSTGASPSTARRCGPAPSARPCCTTCVSPWCSPAKAEATTTPGAWR